MNIALVLCPCWTNYTPPLGLAYLAAVLRREGHTVKCFDLNIRTSAALSGGPVDLWDFSQHYRWTRPHFDETFRTVGPVVETLAADIVAFAPEMIGFSVYYTNVLPCLLLAAFCKARLKHAVTVFGGPECYKEWYAPHLVNDPNVDAVVAGEGEEAVVEIARALGSGVGLNTIAGVLTAGDGAGVRPRTEIADLDALPWPDFSDFPLPLYRKSALPIMTSRGCVGRCSFCGEILYWKNFRWRRAESIFGELERAVRLYGVREVFFNDSLVNGNMRELQRWTDMVIEHRLDFVWGGYARVHPGMSAVLLRRLKAAGCHYLSYGIESGSERVLRDMNKQISLHDARANLRQTVAAGIEAHVNWIVGFPTESWRDFFLSLLFIFRNRRAISNFNPGQAPCGIPLDSYIARNPKKFRLAATPFLGQWRTVGYGNTIIHRRIRLKMLRAWLRMLRIRHS